MRNSLHQLGQDLIFPDPSFARADGLLAYGGDLSEERLLLAYSQGIFPWDDGDSPILWWSPKTRAVLSPAHFHWSRSLRKEWRRKDFFVTCDTNFSSVIRSCADVARPFQSGTWIHSGMQQAYQLLHDRGVAHSIEVSIGGRIVGGLYGVSLGKIFCGESMFSLVPNASKIAFGALCHVLASWGFAWIDCQWINSHLASLGVSEMPREQFLKELELALRYKTKMGSWTDDFSNAWSSMS